MPKHVVVDKTRCSRCATTFEPGNWGNNFHKNVIDLSISSMGHTAILDKPVLADTESPDMIIAKNPVLTHLSGQRVKLEWGNGTDNKKYFLCDKCQRELFGVLQGFFLISESNPIVDEYEKSEDSTDYVYICLGPDKWLKIPKEMYHSYIMSGAWRKDA